MQKQERSVPPESMTGSGEAERLAGLAASLLALVCITARNQAKSRGVDEVHFLTREGVVFQRFFDRFARGARWPEQSVLFHASRLSTFAASLFPEGWRGLGRFFSLYHDANWVELSASLDTAPAIMPGHPVQGIPDNVRGQALAEFISTNEHTKTWIGKIAQRKHRELAEYLAHYHPSIARTKTAVLVDIGWRGSIQDNLARALPEIEWHGVYFGLLPYLNTQPKNCVKSGILFDPTQTEYLAANVMPLEFLFDAGVGGVVGYRGAEPVHSPHRGDEGCSDFVAHFQRALDDRATDYGQLLARASTDETVASLQAAWRDDALVFWAATQHMSAELFEALSVFRHDETFGIASTVQIAHTTSWQSMLRGLFDYRTRRLFFQHSQSIPLHLWRSPQLGWRTRAWMFLLALASKTRNFIKGR